MSVDSHWISTSMEADRVIVPVVHKPQSMTHRLSILCHGSLDLNSRFEALTFGALTESTQFW
jgi:hypothetical protein